MFGPIIQDKILNVMTVGICVQESFTERFPCCLASALIGSQSGLWSSQLPGVNYYELIDITANGALKFICHHCCYPRDVRCFHAGDSYCFQVHVSKCILYWRMTNQTVPGSCSQILATYILVNKFACTVQCSKALFMLIANRVQTDSTATVKTPSKNQQQDNHDFSVLRHANF